jgi:eukaryotic-like serine/threonine-protein kinase
MSCCLNPTCTQPQNQARSLVCSNCGAQLLLKQRYRSTKLLDVGGMSRAFLAVDEDIPGRPGCVVKQFFPSPQVLDNPKSYSKSLELFQREAMQLDKLSQRSSQIPKLLAYLEQDQKFYLVQEYIDGQNLLKDLETYGAYSEEHIRQFLQETLPVLQFVHDQKVIHRDIKPENIMHRQNGQLVLIDFGMSKQLTEQVTSRGTTGGTMGYAPPEQLRAGVAYPASDLFALGATCAHLLTNITPDNLYDFQQDRWVWPDVLAQDHRQVSRQLTEILNKMLRSDVQDRYQSAREILVDLADPIAPSQRALRSKQAWQIAIGTPIVMAGLGIAILSDQIKCNLGIENSSCPVAKGPKMINGVLYFPFEPGLDKNGKSAEFNMAVLSQEYRWKPGSADAVYLGNADQAIPVKDLKPVLESKGIIKIMDNPNQIIAVGMSSCEGPQQAEEVRAYERAKTIQTSLSKTIFAVKDYPLLNLGQFRRDSCSRNAKDNSFQRTMILMGIRKETAGVVLAEALHARLAKISKDFKLDDYSLGSKEKFQLIPDGTPVVYEPAATSTPLATPPAP